MNKKGFTLVELMAVIAIIAIIIGIAVPSYISITKSTNQHVLESKITEIKTKAEDYASANNIDNTTITVATLIKEGYLEIDNADNDDGKLINNPVGGYLDCYIVNISKSDGEYAVNVTENTDCNVDVDSSYSDRINIYAYTYDKTTKTYGESLGSNNDVDWTNKDVILFADLGDLELTSNKVTWSVGATDIQKNTDKVTTVIAGNYDDYANELYVSAEVFLNTEYQVSVETSEGTITKKVTVKIDKEKPFVDVNVASEWTNGNKNMTIMGSDGSGSGIVEKYGFFSTTDKTAPNKDSFNIESVNNQAIVSSDAETYYVYAIDNAGNISDAKKVIISNIDKTGPTCKMVVPYSGVNDGWSHEDITITYGCSDSQTGCKTSDQTKTYSAYANETIEWDIEDNIGNVTKCSKTITVKVDKTTPTTTAKSNPISLGTQDYNFTSNVTTTFGQGGGTVTCDPAASKKTGSYTVTCTATGNNGLSSTVTFTARHSYAATYVSKTCRQSRSCTGTRQVCSQSCHTEQDCGYCNGNNWCCNTATCGSCCSGYYCQSKQVCSNSCHNENYSYDCSYNYDCSYYSCPSGGSLSGTTCNY